MTLTELRYITAVARERHFGRAAESCFVSQPTLSVAVRKLETELGAQDVITHQRLADETLLLLGSGNCFRDQVIKACPECIVGDAGENSMQSTLEGSSLETIRHMVV
jgi:hypothetical protein